MKTTRIFFLLLLCTLSATAQEQPEGRKGLAMEFGLGAGFSTISDRYAAFEPYSVTGLYLSYMIGFHPGSRSSFLFGFKSNIFTEEVSKTWADWNEKTEGDDVWATLATLASPFVYAFSPLFRSHSLIMSLEYTQFTSVRAPCLYFSGNIGVGMLYHKPDNDNLGGLGLGGGLGFQINKNLGLEGDLMYTPVSESHIRALTFCVGLKLFIH